MDGGEQGTKRNEPSSSPPPPHVQHLFVMRHGERLDDADPSWVPKTDRPWDPPLTERGKQQAWEVGKRLRTEGWGITRVVVSPFLRCVQTAAQVVTALCLVDDDDSSHHAAASESSKDAVIDPCKVKVSASSSSCSLSLSLFFSPQLSKLLFQILLRFDGCVGMDCTITGIHRLWLVRAYEWEGHQESSEGTCGFINRIALDCAIGGAACPTPNWLS